MRYLPAWMEEQEYEHIQTVSGFGSLYLLHFIGEVQESEAFDIGQEQDEQEAKADAEARKFKSRYLVVRGDGSEIWTSSQQEGERLLGAANTLFG